MRFYKSELLTSTVLPIVLGVGLVAGTVGTGTIVVGSSPAHAGCRAKSPCAAKEGCGPCGPQANPCAGKRR